MQGQVEQYYTVTKQGRDEHQYTVTIEGQTDQHFKATKQGRAEQYYTATIHLDYIPIAMSDVTMYSEAGDFSATVTLIYRHILHRLCFSWNFEHLFWFWPYSN